MCKKSHFMSDKRFLLWKN